MKKIVFMLFISLLIFAGCSSNGSSTQEVVTSLTEPVDITFWHAFNGEQEDALITMTEQFNAENEMINVTLENQGDYQTLQKKIDAAGQSDTLPTMAIGYSNWMYEYVQNDYLTNLTPYFNNPEIGIDSGLYVDAFIEEVTAENGDIYGVPFNKSTEVLFYNSELLAEAGVEVPTTDQELVSASKTITQETGVTGVGFDSLSNFLAVNIMTCGITSWVDDNGQMQLDNPCVAQGVQAYQDGINAGYARVAGEDTYLSGPFGNGDLAMNIGSTAGYSFIDSSVNGKFEYKIAPYPGDIAPQQGTNLMMFNTASPEEQYAAWQYMKYLTSDESTIYWAQATGYMPVTKAAYESPEYQEYMQNNEIAMVSYEQMDNMEVIVPVFGGSNEIYTTLFNDFMSATLESNKAVDEELTTLNQNAQDIYDRNN